MAQFVPLTVHDMKAPYPEDMMDRAKINMLTPNGWVVGDIVTSRNPDPKKFGMRADWLIAIEADGKTFRMQSHDFTKAQILGIRKSADPALPFEVRLV